MNTEQRGSYYYYFIRKLNSINTEKEHAQVEGEWVLSHIIKDWESGWSRENMGPIPTRQSSLSHNTIAEVGEICARAAGLANLEDPIRERLKWGVSSLFHGWAFSLVSRQKKSSDLIGSKRTIYHWFFKQASPHNFQGPVQNKTLGALVQNVLKISRP